MTTQGFFFAYIKEKLKIGERCAAQFGKTGTLSIHSKGAEQRMVRLGSVLEHSPNSRTTVNLPSALHSSCSTCRVRPACVDWDISCLKLCRQQEPALQEAWTIFASGGNSHRRWRRRSCMLHTPATAGHTTQTSSSRLNSEL